ncbi:MAG: adenylate kinase [Gammaproteobacteria bacterium]|jgi:adenylate kinase
MNIILLGPPGAGKGTIAKALNKYDGSVQISTGDILRRAVVAGTELGKKVEAAMTSGNLVTDDVIIGIMEQRLLEDDCKQGYLLDGFPRTIVQADALKVLLKKMGEKVDCVLELIIPRDTIMERLATRRTCTQCGEIFNIKFKPSMVDGTCDACGGDIVQRDDETQQAIDNRLKVYEEQTAPLVDYYRKEGLLLSVETSDFGPVLAALKAHI